MRDTDTDPISERIAAQVRELRKSRGFSLAALEERSGVSRSMISLIERAETSPTAVILDKLAVGLGVPMAHLFNLPDESIREASPVARKEDQPLWKDPGSGYLRRVVSAPGGSQSMQVVEVEFPARARVVFECGERDSRVRELVWLLEGAMNITVGAECHKLREGDCLTKEPNVPTMFHNPTFKPARYAVFSVFEPLKPR